VQVSTPSESRGLCDSMINGKGFLQNYTLPDIVYINWFADNFAALKKRRAASVRVLGSMDSDLPPLKLGSVVDFDQGTFGSDRQVGN
jgi:hypothetical protein